MERIKLNVILIGLEGFYLIDLIFILIPGSFAVDEVHLIGIARFGLGC